MYLLILRTAVAGRDKVDTCPYKNTPVITFSNITYGYEAHFLNP